MLKMRKMMSNYLQEIALYNDEKFLVQPVPNTAHKEETVLDLLEGPTGWNWGCHFFDILMFQPQICVWPKPSHKAYIYIHHDEESGQFS